VLLPLPRILETLMKRSHEDKLFHHQSYSLRHSKAALMAQAQRSSVDDRIIY